MVDAEQKAQLKLEARLMVPNEDFSGLGYLVSNEKCYQVFEPALRKVSGGYFGVGSYQNLWMIGTMNSEVGVIVDRDPGISELMADIVAAHKEEGVTPTHIRLRLSKLPRVAFDIANNPSWLSDRECFDHVRKMAVEDRIWIINADLNNLYSAYDTPVGAAYLTNAEDHMVTGRKCERMDTFYKNLSTLPFSDQAIILRSFMPKNERVLEDTGDIFCYAIQSAREACSGMMADYWYSREIMNAQALITASNYVDLRPRVIHNMDPYIHSYGR